MGARCMGARHDAATDEPMIESAWRHVDAAGTMDRPIRWTRASGMQLQAAQLGISGRQ